MAERVYSVTQLTLSVRRNLLANNEKIAGAWIEGEVSGNKVYSSGHRYFTLKDKDAAISCVLFAFNLRTCDEDFKKALAKGEDTVNGLKVQVEGELDLNMLRGQYAFFDIILLYSSRLSFSLPRRTQRHRSQRPRPQPPAAEAMLRAAPKAARPSRRFRA